MVALAPIDLAPQQDRSRKTRRRILAAVNRLLRARSFESLSVQEIALAAECSIGAFYGRFRGKDELLPSLLDWHNRAIERWITRALRENAWGTMTLHERLTWVVRMAVGVFRRRRWLIRALAVYVRRDGIIMPESQVRRRTGFSVRVRDALMDHSELIAHPEASKSDAVDFALFMIATLCRERILFGELSERAWIATDDEVLIREVASSACAYLTTPRAPPAGVSARPISSEGPTSKPSSARAQGTSLFPEDPCQNM